MDAVYASAKVNRPVTPQEAGALLAE